MMGIHEGPHEFAVNRENLQEYVTGSIQDKLDVSAGVEGVWVILQQPGRRG